MEHFGDLITNFLKKATIKIEELQLQTALGTAELADYFEVLKKESLADYHQLKVKLDNQVEKALEKKNEVKGKLEHLELQLALGKAESMEVLAEQKKNLRQAIKDLSDIISND